jgi:hypothetical protein
MQAMPAITAAATRRVLSGGALLAFGGGLALYQLTSLVLGPAGSRTFDLSLTIPAVDVDEASLPPTLRVNPVLGILAPMSAAAATLHRASARSAVQRTAAPAPAAPTIAPAVPVTPVVAKPLITHPPGKSKPNDDD